jgi:hypothetical protein
MEKSDIRAIVDGVVDDISSGNYNTSNEPETILEESEMFNLDLVEEGLVEESVKETIGKVANESLKIVKDKIKKDYTEYGPKVQQAAAAMGPEIITAILKKDKKTVTKVAEVSGLACKHYVSQMLADITGELITTGTAIISKDIKKKYDEIKKSMGIEDPVETEYEVID